MPALPNSTNIMIFSVYVIIHAFMQSTPPREPEDSGYVRNYCRTLGSPI
ncbi:MAG TPA: hypothetical protein VGJ48_25600 [Pyrinomonadaceae bacterium]